MTQVEGLRAQLKAAGNLQAYLFGTAASAERLASKLQTVSQVAATASGAFSTLDGDTSSVTRSMSATAVTAQSIKGQLQDVATSALRAAGGASTVREKIDALGGDSLATASEIGALKQNLGGLPDDAIASSTTVNELAGELDDLGVESSEAWRQIDNLNDKTDGLINNILPAVGSADALSDELDEVAEASRRSALSASVSASRIETLGDDALATSAKMQALDHSLNDTARSSAGLTTALGPLRGRLSTLGPAFLAAAPAAAGLASSLGGIATAGGAAAGALGGILTGGLLRRAEQMAALNEDIAGRGEALEQIFSNFKDQLISALDPIKSIANARLVTDAFEGAVDLAGEFATSLAGIAPLVRELGRSLGGSVLSAAPAIFDELATTVRTLGPALEDILSSGIRSIPNALAFFRTEAEQLLPELRSLGGSLLSTGAAVADFGSNILDLVLPALTPMVDLFGGVANAAARLPKPLLLASAAAGVATVAVGTYGGAAAAAVAASSALAGVLATITAPISALSVGVGALVGVLALGAAKLGLFSTLLNSAKAVIGGVVSTVEFAINSFLDLYDALGVLRFVLFPGIAAVELLIASFHRLKPVFAAVGGVIVGIGEKIQQVLAGIANSVGVVINAIDKATNALGLDNGNTITGEVDLSAANPTVDGGGASSIPPASSTQSSPSGPRSGRSPKQSHRRGGRGGDLVIDMRNSQFGSDRQRTREDIKQAVREANREDREREEGRP